MTERPCALNVHRHDDDYARRCGALRVLVVEDDPGLAEAMEGMLELLGHEVRLAYDGIEAIEVAKQFEPDVLLCDLGLPGKLDGYDVARALRDDPLLARCQRVALTGNGSVGDRVAEAGFDLYMVKPLDVQLVERLLGSHVAVT